MNKSYILKKNEDIQDVVKDHKSVGSTYYNIYYKKDDNIENIKIAISASKKLGNAVTRNYNKRITKEILRGKIAVFKGYNVLWVIKSTSLSLSFEDKKNQVDYIIKKFVKEINNEKK